MNELQHTGRAIVLPAVFPGSNEMSHCTVKFLGTAETMEGTRDQALSALFSLQRIYGGPGTFRTKGTDWFGVDRDIPVMRLETSWLTEFHRRAEHYLADENVYPQASTWEYQPHVTLASDDIDLPELVTLMPPVLWWEDERPVSVPWLNVV